MARNGDRLRLSILAALGAGSALVACGSNSTDAARGGSGNDGSGGASVNGGASGSDEAGGRSAGGSFGAGGQGTGILMVTPRPPSDGGWLDQSQEHGTFVVAERRVACHGTYAPSRLVTGREAEGLGAGLCAKNVEGFDAHVYVCFAAPDGGACNAVYDPNCIARTYGCGLFFKAKYVCGPVVEPDTGQCCYAMQGYCAAGR
jgi:hypothetical protein